MTGWPPMPGPGRFPLGLATAGFYVLLLLLLTFALMLWLLRSRYPGRRRGLEGYFEAASIDLGFLIAGFALVVALVATIPHANRTGKALYDVVIEGYWYTFSIPIVTVGTSIHQKTRGGIPWMVPSVIAAIGLFFVLFAYYYASV